MITIFIVIILLTLFISGLIWGDSGTKLAPLFFIGSLAGILLSVFLVMKLLYWIAYNHG